MTTHNKCMAQPCYGTTDNNSAFCSYCWSKVTENTRWAVENNTGASQALYVLDARDEILASRQAQENSTVIEKFFADHAGSEFVASGKSSALKWGSTQKALAMAQKVAQMFGEYKGENIFLGWLVKVGASKNELFINTYNAKTPTVLADRIVITCLFNDADVTCVTCGTQMDAEMLAYELAQEAAQDARLYA